MAMVAGGEVDGATIDSTVLEMAAAADPSVGGNLRVVDSIGPNPAPLLVMSKRLAFGARERLRRRSSGCTWTSTAASCSRQDCWLVMRPSPTPTTTPSARPTGRALRSSESRTPHAWGCVLRSALSSRSPLSLTRLARRS